MSNVKASVKEMAGKVEEEIGEALDNTKMALKGRQHRNEGRIEGGKLPKVSPVGSEKP
ncbi:MAG: hypothetical protein QM667_13415 [Asticcacaulis sp.]